MAITASILPASSALLPPAAHLPTRQTSSFIHSDTCRRVTSRTPASFRVQAVKVPPGVVAPKVQPKFQPPFLGFTRTAEVWNSRACMVGLIGTFIVELILHKGILEMIGVEIGKGLDIPL
uniref:Uncharacterized protein n=1 Tax=Kalanchoe fedtschenkoi TaxID=63787 RepID=A0A7N0RI00_KALFE